MRLKITTGESQTKRASEGQPPAAYGRYKNVFLSDAELLELEQDFPDKWEYYIDRLSCHIASTGKQYHSHAATIYKWAQEDAAKGKAAPKDVYKRQASGRGASSHRP